MPGKLAVATRRKLPWLGVAKAKGGAGTTRMLRVPDRNLDRRLVTALQHPHQRPADRRDDAELQGEAEKRREATETAGQAGAKHQAEQSRAKQAPHEAGLVR